MLFEFFVNVVVHVPATLGDLNVTNAFFDETACEQAALAKLVAAVFFLQGIGLIVQTECLKIGAGHDADRFVVELRVAFHLGGLETLAEAGVELVEQHETLDHVFGGGVAAGVLQADIGVEDGQWRKAGGEEAVAVLRLAVDADIRGQCLVALAFEMLCPSADVGMLDGAALLIAAADHVLSGCMHAGLGTQAADDADLVGLFGEIFHRAAKLEVGLRFDRCLRPLSRPVLGVECVDVRHATDHLQKDDVFGLAETWAGGGSGCGGCFSREQAARRAV